MNAVLKELKSLPNFNDNCVVIKLHGFFQTDDRIALQEITRQLFLENETANKVFGSFAGVMTQATRFSLKIITQIF